MEVSVIVTMRTSGAWAGVAKGKVIEKNGNTCEILGARSILVLVDSIGKDWEFGISRGKLSYTGWINNKVLLYSTGNYIQYLVTNHNGKDYEKI